MNIPVLETCSPSLIDVRGKFWQRWVEWRAKGGVLAAECAWPVEARFLSACVDDLPDFRREQVPYPLVDISSVLLAGGVDPLETHPRLANELPVHHPLADARQSARLLVAALSNIRRRA